MPRRFIIFLLISIFSFTQMNFQVVAQNPIPVPTRKPKPKPKPNPTLNPKPNPTLNPKPNPTPKPKPKQKNTFSQNGNVFTVNGVAFEMVPVAGGQFQMGSNDPEAYDSEKPVHGKYVGDFMIGKTEVTQALWQTVMGSNPSYFKGMERPVEQVFWNDCQTFIQKLNSITGKNFRLPTEAEWEYAAKGGNKSRGYKYSGSDDVGVVAWYDPNSSGETHPVGKKMPNELGIYDMTGNVLEWTSDKWSSYHNSSCNGNDSGAFRVYRGGCYSNYAKGCRVSYRHYFGENIGISTLGLRLAL